MSKACLSVDNPYTMLVPAEHLGRVAGMNQALGGLAGIIIPPLGALAVEILLGVWGGSQGKVVVSLLALALDGLAILLIGLSREILGRRATTSGE